MDKNFINKQEKHLIKDKYVKFLITEQQQALFRKFLTKDDYIKVAEQSSYRTQTVYQKVNRVRQVSQDNKAILENLNIACHSKILEDRDTCTKALKTLRKLPEVRVYNNLKDSDKWI